jgi:hypothetical protein
VPSDQADTAVELLGAHHRGAAVIGTVTDSAGLVELPTVGLSGRADSGLQPSA